MSDCDRSVRLRSGKCHSLVFTDRLALRMLMISLFHNFQKSTEYEVLSFSGVGSD